MLAYGYRTENEGHDRLIEMVESTIKEIDQATAPGKWIVDTIPICASWFI